MWEPSTSPPCALVQRPSQPNVALRRCTQTRVQPNHHSLQCSYMARSFASSLFYPNTPISSIVYYYMVLPSEILPLLLQVMLPLLPTYPLLPNNVNIPILSTNIFVKISKRVAFQALTLPKKLVYLFTVTSVLLLRLLGKLKCLLNLGSSVLSAFFPK